MLDSGVIYRNEKYLYRFTNAAIEMAEKFMVDSIWRSGVFDNLQITLLETENIIMNASKNTETEEADVLFIMNMRKAWDFLLRNLDYGNNIYFLMILNTTVGESLFPYNGKIVFDSEYYDSSNLKIPYIENIINITEEIDTIKDAELKAIKYFCYVMQKKMFVKGNEQVANFIANKILIENHIGIFQFPIEKLNEFNELLAHLDFGNDEEIINFMKNNCIRRIEQSLGDALEGICKDDEEIMPTFKKAEIIVEENGKIVSFGNIDKVKDKVKDKYNKKVTKWVTHFNEVTLSI